MLSVFKASRSFSLQTSQLGLLTDLSNFNCFETFPIWISVLHAAAVGQEGCAGPEQDRPWHPCPGDRAGDTAVFGGGLRDELEAGHYGTARRPRRHCALSPVVTAARAAVLARAGGEFPRDLGAGARREIQAAGE